MFRTRTNAFARRTARTTIVAVLVGLACAGAAAQDAERPGPAGERGEELRARVLELYKTRLQSELQLSDEQAASLFPVVDAMEATRADLRRRKAATVRELLGLLRGGGADADIQAALDRMADLDREQFESSRDFARRMDEPLNVRQRAQWRVLSEQFRQRVDRRVRENRDVRRERRARPGGGLD